MNVVPFHKEVTHMTITVSAKGQLVIPAAIRRRYHLKPKTKVEVFDTGHSIIIRPKIWGHKT